MPQDTAGLDFTPAQKEAIGHSRGHLRIAACPGSGKTEVMAQRIANLIKNGADPKKVVAFTFTEKAAEELKVRIRGILDRENPDKADFGDMFVGTIHSFCFHMLKEVEPAYRSYDILDEAKRTAFVSKPENFFNIIKLNRLQRTPDMTWRITIDQFIRSVNIVITEDVDLAEIKDLEFRDCVQNYLKVIDEEKYFDFSTIIHRLVKVLRQDEGKRKLLGQKIKHVILDEYQDVNRLQESLLELLSKGADSVAVVGDDDQTIYNWRGSDVSMIREFKKRYGGEYEVKEVSLDTNFRSTDAIVHTARKFIEHNSNRIGQAMVSSKSLERKSEKGDIVCRYFEDEKDEIDFIAKTIRGLEGTDFLDKRNRRVSLSLGDFAVLVRRNADAVRIVDHLEKNGIKCMPYNGGGSFDSPEVTLAMDCIGYAFGCKNLESGAVPQIGDLKSRYGEIFQGMLPPEAGPALFAARLDDIRSQVDRIREKGRNDYLGGLGLQEFYFKILDAMGAGDFEFVEAFHRNLAVLSQIISDYESVWVRLRTKEVRNFFYFARAYARTRYAEARNVDAGTVNAVKVLTIHKAKGLEFPAVFVASFRKTDPFTPPNFVDRSLYAYQMYAGGVEDERRLYYTAFTRAEKYLFLTGSRHVPGDERDYPPHPFLDEIPKEYVSDGPAAERPRLDRSVSAGPLRTYSSSFSKLSSYNRCPYEFKLRHIHGYNAGVPIAFGYGANIHNALNVIHSDYIANGKIPTDVEIEAIFNRVFKLRYATKNIAEKMKKSGLDVVRNYVRLHKDDFGRILETEKSFEFVINDALISGSIDLLKKTDGEGGTDGVEIIDFKSERRDGAYGADHERQLRYYAIACLESLGLRPEKAYVHHLDDGGRDYVDISDRHLDETKEEIAGQIKSILDGGFPPDPEKMKCADCDYRSICPHKESTTSA